VKFAIGYQLPDEDQQPLTQVVGRFREQIEEVYFAWPGMPSGRAPLERGSQQPHMGDNAHSSGQDDRSPDRLLVDWDAQRQLEEDLRAFKAMGIKLDLLFNANCYGGESLSQALAARVCSIIKHLLDTVGLDTVTTTSLMVARTVKEHFPRLDVRASVNMRIGTVKGMEYVADLFDSFYIQREYNRDFERIRELKGWAVANGKTIHFLVNSGCMNFCSGQTFHDNLVAHEAEIVKTVNVRGWNPSLCWNYYADPDHWPSLLQNSWVRPEDIHHYDGLFSVAKLATRMHADPARVIEAYCTGRYHGNLLDLFEPGHGPLLAPYVIDNERFPADWFERTTECDKRCERCGYCHEVLGAVLTKMSF